jgi:hypothetical protein
VSPSGALVRLPLNRVDILRADTQYLTITARLAAIPNEKIYKITDCFEAVCLYLPLTPCTVIKRKLSHSASTSSL